MHPKIFLGLPWFGNSGTLQTTLSLLALTKGRDAFVAAGLSHPDIADSRNVLATIFLDGTDCTHLLMIDYDMTFEPDLILDMIEFDHPICGALYRQKTDTEMRFVLSGRKDPQEIKHGRFLRVDGVGGGILLIKRECLEKMATSGQIQSDLRLEKHGAAGVLQESGCKRLLRFFDLYDDGVDRFSEDLSFCKRARDHGIEIWGAIGHTVGHIGLKEFSGNFLEFHKPHLKPVMLAAVNE